MSDTTIFSVAPGQLAAARLFSHAAVQWPSRAARANLPAAADDSHSNLGWDQAQSALLSHPLDPERRHQLGFSFQSFSLLWLEDGVLQGSLALHQATETDAGAWCDEQLASAGLQPTGQASMPYELDPVEYRDFADAATAEQLAALGAWYSVAQANFETLVARFGDLSITQPAIRCWPHHYDLGTLFVLEEGDPETARSVGLGLSPGDGSYSEPYFYCTPWPTPPALPTAPPPGHWHTEGFTSLVLPASAVAEDLDLLECLATAIERARTALD